MNKFLKRSSLTIGGLLMGALLVVSVQQVGANLLLNTTTLQTINTSNTSSNFGPASAPPNGDISPTVTSLTVLDSLNVVGTITNTGKDTVFDQAITVPSVLGEERGASGLTELSLQADTFTNSSPTQIFNYGSSNFGNGSSSTTSVAGRLTVSGNTSLYNDVLILGGDLKVNTFDGNITARGKIGSYKKYITSKSITSNTIDRVESISVACPSGTQVVSCDGRVLDYRRNFIYQGTVMDPIDGYQRCSARAIANRSGHAGSSSRLYVSAMCFNPNSSADTTSQSI